MLGQSRRRWTNINTTLAECLMLVRLLPNKLWCQIEWNTPYPHPQQIREVDLCWFNVDTTSRLWPTSDQRFIYKFAENKKIKIMKYHAYHVIMHDISWLHLFILIYRPQWWWVIVELCSKKSMRGSQYSAKLNDLDLICFHQVTSLRVTEYWEINWSHNTTVQR